MWRVHYLVTGSIGRRVHGGCTRSLVWRAAVRQHDAGANRGTPSPITSNSRSDYFILCSFNRLTSLSFLIFWNLKAFTNARCHESMCLKEEWIFEKEKSAMAHTLYGYGLVWKSNWTKNRLYRKVYQVWHFCNFRSFLSQTVTVELNLKCQASRAFGTLQQSIQNND